MFFVFVYYCKKNETQFLQVVTKIMNYFKKKGHNGELFSLGIYIKSCVIRSLLNMY